MPLFSSKKDSLAGAPVASQLRFSRSWLPLGYGEKPREAFLESGRSPDRAMAGPSDDLRWRAHKRNETERNDTWDKTER